MLKRYWFPILAEALKKFLGGVRNFFHVEKTEISKITTGLQLKPIDFDFWSKFRHEKNFWHLSEISEGSNQKSGWLDLFS